MTRDELTAALGREPSATDQPPGLYATRKPCRKSRDGNPGKAVEIVYNGEVWGCLVNGELERGSGALDPQEIPFILWNSPFWPATPDEHAATMKASLEYAPPQQEEI